MLDCSPAFCSFLNLFLFRLLLCLSCHLPLAFQPDPFGFSQKDFGLKPFSFWENQKDLAGRLKEDDEEEREEDDEEDEKDEQKAGDYSSKE